MKNNRLMRKFHKMTWNSIYYAVVPIMLLAVVLCFMLYFHTIRTTDDKILTNEFKNVTSKAELFDNICYEMQAVLNYLSIDENMNIYLSSDSPYETDKMYNLKIDDKIKTIASLHDYVESVYVYTDANVNLCSVGNYDIKDVDWLQHLKKNILKPEFDFRFRTYNNNYPYFLTITKQFKCKNNNCAIAVNLNLKELYEFIGAKNLKEFYIVQDDKIVYKNKMQNMFVPFEKDPVLKNSLNIKNKKSFFVFNGRNKTVLSKTESLKYVWQYILVSNSEDYIKEASYSKNLFLFLIGAIIILSVFFIFRYTKGVIVPIQTIENLIDRQYGVPKDSVDIGELENLSDKIAYYVNTNDDLKDRLNENLSDLKRLQMQSLKTQINPHFMFNALNTIYMQSIEDFNYDYKKNTSKMLLILSKYLRYVLESDSELVSIEKEFKNTQMYVEILKKRYEKLKKVEWDLDSAIMDKKIIRICFQPIIENSVYHGISNAPIEEGNIYIKGKIIDDSIVISIKDNGKGISEDSLLEIRENLDLKVKEDFSHIGLRNVNQRLKLTYGDKYGLKIESEIGKGTIVTIIIPIIN